MKQLKEIICVSCPVGCVLSVSADDSNIEVSGHQCNAGITYAREELLSPTRNIATSVKIADGDMCMLSVKTASPIPKSAIGVVVAAIHKVDIAAPVAIGDVVLANVAGTGVDIVATRNVCRVI